jgi:CRISPR/Cas system CMR subunit Cmr4 (Cas7 group RAMP superfamily)
MEAVRGNFIFKFLSEWHCSSGLTGTSEIDLTVIKDDEGFPYIPGRTIKGLLRDFAQSVFESLEEDKWGKFIEDIFGSEGDKHGKVVFSNAIISDNLKKEALKAGNNNDKNKSAVQYIYTRRTFTKIDENTGTAEDKTLRSIEFVIPLILISEWHCLSDISTEDIDMLKICAKGVKRLGLNRNRGFGRCECLSI